MQILDVEDRFCSEINVHLLKNVSYMKASRVSFTEAPSVCIWFDLSLEDFFVVLESKSRSV